MQTLSMRLKLESAFDNFLIMPAETDLGIYEGSEGTSTCSCLFMGALVLTLTVR